MNITRRKFLLTLLFFVVLEALGVYLFMFRERLHGQVFDPPAVMPDFTLQSADGPVSLTDFRGKMVVLYFGYTSCPDLCPTTLGILKQAMDNLGDKSKEVQVIFVSVDPKRDTPEKLKKYISFFREDFIAVTGTQAQIDIMTKDFGIYYYLYLPDANGFYSVDHTANVRVIDRNGNLVVIWPFSIKSNEVASDLKILVRK